MAIFYPDLSHYDLDRGVRVESGTVAVIAKATHGTLFLDRGYAIIRQQALAVGAVFAGYHWLNHGNGAGQADYYYSQVGATPCMIDAEDEPGNTGYNGPLTVQDIVDFVTALRVRGGICNLAYLPRWYWDQHMGGPSLQPLQDLGIGLVASDYVAYSDTGPGWDVYRRDTGEVEPSGLRPVCWQYTDALPYGGSTCDFDAFRGSLAEFRALITANKPEEDTVISLVKQPNNDTVWRCEGGFRVPIPSMDHLKDIVWVAGQGYTAPIANGGQIIIAGDLDAFGQEYPPPSAPAQATTAPTQDQVDAAVLKALQDPAVLKGIGDAIAAHLHVN